MKKYVVRLDADERERLQRLVRSGRAAAYKIRHAHMLLMADTDGRGWADEQICEGLGVRDDIPAVVELIERTARWVHPDTFRALPVWAPHAARGRPLYDAGWSRR